MSIPVRILISAAMLTAIPVCADDGAASIAAGGLVVMGRESRIVMAKEALHISVNKVVVDYDFRNNSDEDISTEVAFPIPDYDLEMESIKPSEQGFDDFRLWVDGEPTQFRMESRALVKGRDFTQLLTSMHVDIASFGRATSNDDSPDVKRLDTARRRQLEHVGLIDADDSPNWRVRKKYYWRQNFPAHKIVHIRHEYSPQVGSENSIKYGMGYKSDPESVKALQGFCIDGRLRTTLQQIANSKGKDAPYFYVDFILTTADTWKRPIEDFTLIVERPRLEASLANYVSFCWDGPVTKIDAGHFSAKAINFIPKKELHVGFFSVQHGAF